MLVGVPYLTGYLLLAYGHMVTEPVAFKCVVLLGRFVTGIGLGWSCLAVPVSELMIASVSIPGSCCFKLDVQKVCNIPRRRYLLPHTHVSVADL